MFAVRVLRDVHPLQESVVTLLDRAPAFCEFVWLVT
jgi:hypothetical protein